MNGRGLSPTASACSPPAVSPPSAWRLRACPWDALENNASKVEPSRAKGESALPFGRAEKGASEEPSNNNNKPPAQSSQLAFERAGLHRFLPRTNRERDLSGEFRGGNATEVVVLNGTLDLSSQF